MDPFVSSLVDTVGNHAVVILGVLVFATVGMLSFSVMAAARVRGAVRRRAAGISAEAAPGGRSLRGSSLKAAHRLIEYTTKHYMSLDDDSMKVLRRRLVQAGIFDPRAVGYFFFCRTVLAVALAAGAYLFVPTLMQLSGSMLWLAVGAGGIAGYVGPTMYIDRRIKARVIEHRAGFPDFMDLLVVCADSGLSMEAALDRVGRELSDSYPSLSANIHMTNLEIRAGRTLSEALEHLSERLGLEEARSFATLIQQSAELGSSITDALRVYSDDMRHKRLSRAEEKAYSLPVRLSVPMMVCIFPVLFVVILLPVAVRVLLGKF
jgi:tight adherence protein C